MQGIQNFWNSYDSFDRFKKGVALAQFCKGCTAILRISPYPVIQKIFDGAAITNVFLYAYDIPNDMYKVAHFCLGGDKRSKSFSWNFFITSIVKIHQCISRILMVGCFFLGASTIIGNPIGFCVFKIIRSTRFIISIILLYHDLKSAHFFTIYGILSTILQLIFDFLPLICLLELFSNFWKK